MISSQQTFGATYINTGFEAPTYSAGKTLASQPTSSSTQFQPYKPAALITGSVASSVQTYTSVGITPTQPNNLQVAELQSVGIGDDSAAYIGPVLSTISPITQGTPIVDIAVDLLSQNGQGGSGVPAFGISAFDGTNNPFVDLYVGSNGAVYYDSNDPKAPVTPVQSAYVASPTAFTRYDLQLNYLTQTYSITANGSTPVGAGSFVDTTFTTGTFNASGISAGTSSGIGLYDGFTITANAVPEPTTASVVIGGLAIAGLRRRRSAAR